MKGTLRKAADEAVDAIIKTAEATQEDAKSKEEIPEDRKEDAKTTITKNGFFIVVFCIVMAVILGLLLGSWAVKKEKKQENYSIYKTDSPIDPDLLGQLSPTLVEATKEPQIVFGNPGPAEVNLEISLFILGISLVLLITFLETFSRRERFLLDWWISPVMIILLLMRGLIPSTLWVVLITGFSVLNLIAIFYNESLKTDNLWSQVDLTSLSSTSAILLMIAYSGWEKVVYPYYIPLWITFLVFVVSTLRELSRTWIVSIVTVALGIAMGLTLNPWIIAGSMTVSLVSLVLSAKQGWAIGKRRNGDVNADFGNQVIAENWPWDIFLGMLYAFIITTYLINGNFVLLSF